jgi:hypothetical protein
VIRPATVAELTAHGWRLAEESLRTAGSDRALVTHWFLTPADADVHMDEHFGSNERTLTFVSVVIPTLAQQLDARMLTVSVPWDAAGEPSLLAVIATIPGQPAVVEARELIRLDDRSAAPWWHLAQGDVEVPADLQAAVTGLRV